MRRTISLFTLAEAVLDNALKIPARQFIVTMSISDWAIGFATLLGPVLAVQAQKWVERLHEQKNRQEWIFRTLMTTRMYRVSPEHVRALNMITLDFRGNKNKVNQAWKVYLDHLNSLQLSPSNESLATWASRGDELFNALLVEMAKYLRYDFGQVELRREIYSPLAHGEQEQVQLLIQKRLADILAGKDALPVKVTSAVDVQQK